MALATTALVAGCTSHSTAPADDKISSEALGPQAGVVHSTDGRYGVEVAAGAAQAGTRVRFHQLPQQDQPAVPAGSVEVGEAVAVTPSKPLRGGTVRVAFDASSLPHAQPGQSPPAIGNAYIAILDETFRGWVPLVTRYDMGTRELVAVMPHFSTIRTFVTAPGRYAVKAGRLTVHFVVRVGEAGANVLGDIISAAGHEFVNKLLVQLPDDQKINCGAGSKNIGVTAHDVTMGRLFKACAAEEKGRRVVKVQNNYAFPFSFSLKMRGVTAGWDDRPKDLDLIRTVRFVAGLLLDETISDGPGSTQFAVSERAPAKFTVDARADWPTLAIDYALTIFAVIFPEEKGVEVFAEEFFASVFRVSVDVEGKLVLTWAQIEGKLTVYGESKGKSQQAKDLGGILELSKCVFEAARAAPTFIHDPNPFSHVKQKWEVVVNVVAKCSETAIGKLAEELKSAAVGLASQAKSLPEVAENEISTWAKRLSLGRVDPSHATIDIRRLDSLPDGQYYSKDVSANPGTKEFTFNQIQWWWGQDAARACARYHVPVGVGELCHNYYWRDDNPRKRTLTVASTARITVVIGGSSVDTLTDLTGLAAQTKTAGASPFYQFKVDNGVIVLLKEVFVP